MLKTLDNNQIIKYFFKDFGGRLFNDIHNKKFIGINYSEDIWSSYQNYSKEKSNDLGRKRGYYNSHTHRIKKTHKTEYLQFSKSLKLEWKFDKSIYKIEKYKEHTYYKKYEWRDGTATDEYDIKPVNYINKDFKYIKLIRTINN